MSDDLVKRLDNLWSMLEDEGFYTKANTAILAANRIEELEAALLELIDHTHNCEKELTEELHHQDFCGESLPLTKARATLATLKGESHE